MIRNDELEAAEVESTWRGGRLRTKVLEVDQSSTPHPGLSLANGSPGCMRRAVPGFSRAPNYAAAAARNEILSLIDDDVLVLIDWFLFSAVAAQDPARLVTGRVEQATQEITAGFSPSLIAHDSPAVFDRYAKMRDVRYLAPYRSALHDAGGFDERLGPGTRFPAAEDNDLAFRLPKAGYQIAYVHEAMGRRARTDYLAVRCNYGKGQGAFHARYPNRERSSAPQRLHHETPKYLRRSLRGFRIDRGKVAGDALFAIERSFGANEWLRRRSLPD